MKKLFTLLSFCTITASAFSQFALNYPGTGAGGFGNVLTGGTLNVQNNGTNVNFILTKGSGDFNDATVIYIDSKTGGFAGTSTFVDVVDNMKKGVSGFDGTNRSAVTFATGFNADYAILLKPNAPDNFGGLYELGSLTHNFVTSVNLTPSNSVSSATYSFTCTKAQLGIVGTVAFRFIASHLNATNAFRSNEAIGFTIAGGNVGQAPVTATTWATYNNGTMPANLTYFSGDFKNGNANLGWQSTTEVNFSQYEVEQSANASNWDKIATVPAKGNNSIYTASAVMSQNTWYRLKMVDKDGSFAYSNAVLLKTATKKSIELLSNPIKDVVRVSINNSTSNYTVEIFTVDGKRVAVKNYQHSGGVSTLTINAPNAKGLYYIKFTNASTIETLKFMVD